MCIIFSKNVSRCWGWYGLYQSCRLTGIIENRAGRGGGGVREEEGGLISLGRDVGYERRKPESERCKKESEKSKLQRKSLRRQQEKCDRIQKSARGEKVQKGEKWETARYRRGGGTWRRRKKKTRGRSEEIGAAVLLLAHGTSVGGLEVSLTSPSAKCLCLSFQTLAQRISEAHAHTSTNKHTAQSDPYRYRHALILTAKVLKMWALHSAVKWVRSYCVVRTQTYTRRHTGTTMP